MVIENINLITERLLTAKEDSEQNITSSSELVSVLESEYEHIKEQNDRNLHLAQIGMAVGIINHEFNHNILLFVAASMKCKFSLTAVKISEQYMIVYVLASIILMHILKHLHH
jgi:hypothetical protein